MMLRTLSLLAVPLILLHACAGAPAAQPSAPAPATDPCNAANAQFAVGRVADARLQAEVRERSGARTVRVIRPNDMVTMDYSIQRLNLELDDKGKVARVRCG